MAMLLGSLKAADIFFAVIYNLKHPQCTGSQKPCELYLTISSYEVTGEQTFG